MGVKVYLRNGRDMEELKRNMRKFKKILDKDGFIKDQRRHEFYEKPSILQAKADHRRELTIMRFQRIADEQNNKGMRGQKNVSYDREEYQLPLED